MRAVRGSAGAPQPGAALALVLTVALSAESIQAVGVGSIDGEVQVALLSVAARAQFHGSTSMKVYPARFDMLTLFVRLR